MKKTAVLLYPLFCNYELSIALSALGQVDKPITFFGPEQKPVRSEEKLPVWCDMTITETFDIEDYDSLLLTGCIDPMQSFMLDERYYDFVRRFDRPDIVIGAISSAPILLSMSGILRDRHFSSGVPEEIFEEVRLNPANQVKDGPYCEEDNLITAGGWDFIPFGVRFAQKIGLDIQPGWYGIK